MLEYGLRAPCKIGVVWVALVSAALLGSQGMGKRWPFSNSDVAQPPVGQPAFHADHLAHQAITKG
jgi:hypothetical protein